MTRKFYSYFITVLFVINPLISCGSLSNGEENHAKNFKLKSMSENKFYTLESLKGEPIVINFWASWCAPCKLEMPFLEKNWKEYREKGVKFVGINVMDDKGEAVKTLEEFNITYLNLYDSAGDVSNLYDIIALPVTLFIDKKGKITHKNYGPYIDEQGENRFKKSIKKIHRCIAIINENRICNLWKNCLR